MKTAFLSLIILLVTVGSTVGIFYMSSKLKDIDKPSVVQQIITSVPQTILPAYQNNQSWVVLSANPNIKLGEDKLRVLVSVDSGQNYKNGAHLVIKFDPQYLQVVDSLPKKPGVQVRLSKTLFAYDQILSTEADNKTGVIDIELRKNDRATVSESYFATIDFKPVTGGQTSIYTDRSSTQIYYTKLKTQPQMIFKDATVYIN